ncbi:twin-arginine translocation signal domain-containing protein [Halarcobacter anaerophilus]|nr:twin-arginine translocation signal domain-containing protein [Halarcobacter anaerophilus]
MHKVSRRQFLRWSGVIGGSVAATSILPIPTLASKNEKVKKLEYDSVK